jgi:hypothetical protein
MAERDRPEIEITEDMIDAAERALLAHAECFDLRSLDELTSAAFRKMLEAALSRLRTTKRI